MAVGRVRALNSTRRSVIADRIEPASSLWARFMGLMGRASLGAGEGLWLPGSNGIHMMFMRFPIDAVFVGRAGAGISSGEDPPARVRRVVGLRRGLRPWTGVVWFVRGADGVLELPAGTIDATGTAIGDEISIEA